MMSIPVAGGADGIGAWSSSAIWSLSAVTKQNKNIGKVYISRITAKLTTVASLSSLTASPFYHRIQLTVGDLDPANQFFFTATQV